MIFFYEFITEFCFRRSSCGYWFGQPIMGFRTRCQINITISEIWRRRCCYFHSNSRWTSEYFFVQIKPAKFKSLLNLILHFRVQIWAKAMLHPVELDNGKWLLSLKQKQHSSSNTMHKFLATNSNKCFLKWKMESVFLIIFL